MTAWLLERFASALRNVRTVPTELTRVRVPCTRARAVGLTLGLLTLTALLGSSSNSPVASASPPRGFNRDHHADLVIGIPNKDIGAALNAGGVRVLYGQGTSGLSTTGAQWWRQGLDGIADSPESDDNFGYSLAIGDYNGDGYYDLGVGVPYQDVGTAADAGAVHVLYGSAAGLASLGNQFWTQNSSGVQGTSETGDRFGWALAAGDFNGDGRDDLAIGVPYEDAGATADGAVNILYGSPTGLTAGPDQLFYQGYNGLAGPAANGDRFGYSLAVGDFNRDGRDDLAVGMPYKDCAGGADCGSAMIIYASPSGLEATSSVLFSQATSGVGGTPEPGDMFARALATGDFDGDGYADLAVGVPLESTGNTVLNNGAVNILFGSAAGLTGNGSQLLYQGLDGVAGAAEDGDEFGFSLAAGDFNHDGLSDLAVGTPLEDNGFTDNGVVVIIYGSSTGLTGTDSIYLMQGRNGVLGTAADVEYFGWALASGDFDGDDYDDLAISVPNETVVGPARAGAVNVVYGSSTGIIATGNQLWNQDSPGMDPITFIGLVLAAAPAQLTSLHLPFIVR